MDTNKFVKVASQLLTTLVSIRAVIRSGTGIKKLIQGVKKPAEKTTKNNLDDKKKKQLHGALLSLGYTRAEVDRVIKDFGDKKIEQTELSELIRASLKVLNA